MSDDDLKLLRNAFVLAGIGLAEISYGALSAAVTTAPVSNTYAWIVLGLGLPTFVASLMLIRRIALGYELSMIKRPVLRFAWLALASALLCGVSLFVIDFAIFFVL